MRVECDRRSDAVWRVELRPGADGQTLIDTDGTAQLLELLEQADAAPHCRIIVVDGCCQGMDLASVASLPRGQVKQEIERFAACLARLSGSTKLVIATVDGEVAGGGVGIAAAADLLIASERSSFALPELVLGLLPSLVLPLLMRRLPQQRARWLCFVPGINAAEARAIGLVDCLTAPEELERSLRTQIKHALRLSPEAVAELKQLQQQILDKTCLEALSMGADRTAEILTNADRVGTARALSEGVAPPWFDHYRPERSR